MTMKHIIICFLSLGLTMVATMAHPIIPEPVSYINKEGVCKLPKGGFVYAPESELEGILKSVNAVTGLNFRMAPADASCAIQFLPGEMRGKVSGEKIKMADGAYEMRVLSSCVNIYADTPSGRFYGLQSLLQLLSAAEKNDQQAKIPCAVIKDRPRFLWRGYMLDESRHFSGVDAVKRTLDTMAYYKMNRFHWHLTDSTGWRIEIKKYPKLTTVGGIGNQTNPDAPATFYTQEQIKDIVAYARERHITVIPEIDMPGHANAAVRAYPEHSGGKNKRHGEFTFHPASPATDAFLTNILDEVKGLFPDAGIIHYGGDEVHYGWDKWPMLPAVKQRMEQDKVELKDIEKAFNQRMAKVINGLGYKTGGWDEVAYAGLHPKKTVIFWWRHDKPESLYHSLKSGYEVILCPRKPCYFDFVQHDSHKVGRRWDGFVPIKDTYQFPDTLKLPKQYSGRVLGIQACLWTEETETQARRDFMAFPRLLALAEAAWTPQKSKNFVSFEKRLKTHLPQLKARGIGFYDPFAHSPEVEK